jgi:hypothetical protein
MHVRHAAEQATGSSRHTPENMAVLREQVPYLADEGLWARETGDLAAGVTGPLYSNVRWVTHLQFTATRHCAAVQELEAVGRWLDKFLFPCRHCVAGNARGASAVW